MFGHFLHFVVPKCSDISCISSFLNVSFKPDAKRIERRKIDINIMKFLLSQNSKVVYTNYQFSKCHSNQYISLHGLISRAISMIKPWHSSVLSVVCVTLVCCYVYVRRCVYLSYPRCTQEFCCVFFIRPMCICSCLSQPGND